MIISNKGEPERKFRAMQIVGLIGVPLHGKNVLDFGCDTGHVTEELARQSKHATGYDKQPESSLQATHWAETKEKNILFTTDREQVAKNAPYDLILAYDVLDHLVEDDPTDIMLWLRELLADDGLIFVRNHPWTAKHGGHLYDQVNKAYLHLALTADELVQRGLQLSHNLKISRPMAIYERWYKDAGLKIIDKKIEAENPEEFFSGDLLDRIIKTTWGGNMDRDQALKIMANQFIDYKLSK